MKKSIIDALQQVESVKRNELCRPHIIIGMDCHEDGQPHSGVLLTQGPPSMLLGMIESLMYDLQKTKKDIIQDMTLYKIKDKDGNTIEDKKKTLSTPAEMQQKIENTKNEVEKIIKRLPPEIADKIKKFQEKMNEAIERGDTEELERMRDSMANAKSFDHLIDKKEDDEDFDINEFKG